MEMDEKQQKFCNSIFILCHAVRVVWKYSFPALLSVLIAPRTYVLWVPCEKSVLSKEKSTFIVLYWFSSFISFTDSAWKEKWIIFFTWNKINLIKCSFFSSSYTQHSAAFFIIILIAFCVSMFVCWCLFTLNMLNGFSTAIEMLSDGK